ncbi:MAG: hypothetical protein M9918_23630 [Anaerolineae bacterium]|nr:hypothetical protein [Anaerolineae bacterium]
MGSGRVACADSDETNVPGDPYDTSLVTRAIDLSGYNSVSLDFAVFYNDIDASGGDMFSMRKSPLTAVPPGRANCRGTVTTTKSAC